MVYSYARPSRDTPEGRIAIFQHPLRSPPPFVSVDPSQTLTLPELGTTSPSPSIAPASVPLDEFETQENKKEPNTSPVPFVEVSEEDEEARRIRQETKLQTMSSMSIYLTLLSICVAFSWVHDSPSTRRVKLFEQRSLNCTDPLPSYLSRHLKDLTDNHNGSRRGELLVVVRPLSSCSLSFKARADESSTSLNSPFSSLVSSSQNSVAAAESEDGGGLAGSWWRGWANVSSPPSSLLPSRRETERTRRVPPRFELSVFPFLFGSQANDQSGYIGAAIVGTFVVILAGSWLVRWGLKRRRRSRQEEVGISK